MTIQKLHMLAQSLQSTSRVLSGKGMNELSLMQESVIQLIGALLLDGKAPKVIEEKAAGDVTADLAAGKIDGKAAAAALGGLASAIWIGSASGKAVVFTSISDEDDWQSLPVVLQNFVSQAQIPGHLIAFIDQLALEGDSSHRHCAQPVVLTLAATANGVIPHFGLVTAQLRSMPPEEVQPAILKEMEPYMRIIATGLVGPTSQERTV